MLVSWTPTYLSDLGVSLSSLGVSVLPFLAMFVVDNAWGALANAAIHSRRLSRCAVARVLGGGLVSPPPRSGCRGRARRLTVRRVSQTVGFVAPAVALVCVTFGGLYSPVSTATAVLSVGLGLNAASHAGYWAMLIDLSPQHAGTLCGVSNSIAALPGVVGNTVTGAVLRATGSWSAVFLIVEAVYGVGLLAFLLLARDTVRVRR